MDINYDELMNGGADATFSVGGGGGASVPQGQYEVEIKEVKNELTKNGYPQIHLRCAITKVVSFDDLDGKDIDAPAVGTEFIAKLNVSTHSEGAAKAAGQNIKMLFAVAMWNGLDASSFNKAKLQKNFGNEYGYHANDSIAEKPWVALVDRKRGKPAEKGYYWDHAFNKATKTTAVPASVPAAEDDLDI
jgi:hypothetical protein